MSSHRYFPQTPDDIEAMLKVCGAQSLDDLYSDVPESLRLKKPYTLPPEMSEAELQKYWKAISADNKELTCFAGGGFYHHYCPAAVQSICSRSEFLTAYTPYQPEISQGTLQYIFEYQSMLSDLTGLEICNASMYDGATATAEAMMMAVGAAKKRKRVLVSSTMSPAVCQVLGTYAEGLGIIIEMIPDHNGMTDIAELHEMMGAGDVAAVIVATPNYFGLLENLDGWADLCHSNKALLIVNTHASALAVLRSPAECGADIACGEAQSLGMPLNYGGPGLGYLCTTKALMRKMPGRIVGATTDADGKRVFVLTLQAREQHIRRQKATSNICSNQGIMTLHAAAYLSLMGAEGLAEVNRLSADAAHSLVGKLCATGKVRLKYPDKPYLNETTLELTDPLMVDTLFKAAAEKGILAGIKITDDTFTVAATEMCSPDDIDRYVEVVKSL